MIKFNNLYEIRFQKIISRHGGNLKHDSILRRARTGWIHFRRRTRFKNRGKRVVISNLRENSTTFLPFTPNRATTFFFSLSLDLQLTAITAVISCRSWVTIFPRKLGKRKKSFHSIEPFSCGTFLQNDPRSPNLLAMRIIDTEAKRKELPQRLPKVLSWDGSWKGVRP